MSENFDRVELRLQQLMEDPEFRQRLAITSSKVTLKESDPGHYRGVFTDTRVPGSYRFDWVASGEVDAKPFRRSGTFFHTVRVREFNATLIKVTTTPLEADKTQLHLVVTPRDSLGNYLGPGYADRIRVTIPKTASPLVLKDRLDGSYVGEAALDDPEVLSDVGILILGNRIMLPSEEVARALGRQPHLKEILLLVLIAAGLFVVIVLFKRKKA